MFYYIRHKNRYPYWLIMHLPIARTDWNSLQSSIGWSFIAKWLGGCGSARVHAADISGQPGVAGSRLTRFQGRSAQVCQQPPCRPRDQPAHPGWTMTSAAWTLADSQPPYHLDEKPHPILLLCGVYRFWGPSMVLTLLIPNSLSLTAQ